MYQSTQSPYFDDYSQSKQFYRILFKPGYAVQARELTQLQTMIQKQFDRFGTNIFKEGSIVIPGSFGYDKNYKYVKLATTYNSVDADDVLESLVGTVITGLTTGVQAEVINYTLSTTSGDPPTLYVKYTSSGSTGTSSAFSASEVIQNADATISVQAAATAPTGSGTAFSITAGVVFVRGVFAYFDAQTHIVSKYGAVSEKSIGFVIEESIVTSDDDTTLLDPAVGSFNYFAPGADRYKLALTLSSRDLPAASTEDINYIELVRITNAETVIFNDEVQYNILQDTLARRTYDESGDYNVKDYSLSLLNHLKTSNTEPNSGLYLSSDGGDDAKYFVLVGPGKSYVKGYELENVGTIYVETTKARDFVEVTNGTVASNFGNYILVTNINGFPNVAELDKVTFYNRFTTTPGVSEGTSIGTARIRNLQLYSGTAGTSTAVYALWLFDVNINSGYTFEDDVKQVYYNNVTIEDFTADIYPVNTALVGTVSVTNGSNVITGFGTRFNTDLEINDFIGLQTQRFRIQQIISPTTAYASAVATSNVSGNIAFLQSAEIVDSSRDVYISEMPHQAIKTVDPTNLNTIYQTRRVYSRTLAGGSVSITAGTDETFVGYSPENYMVVVASGANDGNHIDLTGRVSRSSLNKVVTFSLSSAGLTNEDVRIITTIQKVSSAAEKRVKTLITNQTVDVTGEAAATAVSVALNKADVYQLKSVTMSANAFGTAYSTTGEIDITTRYTLDNGQKATHYDLGRINLNTGSAKPTGPIRITFDYFNHSDGDYFSSDSYPDLDYEDIPNFTTGGKTYRLRDCLDFRSRINDVGTGFSSTGAKVTEFLDFENDLITDYQYYLPRTDKLVLDSKGSFKIIPGVSSLNPQDPPTPVDAMAIARIVQSAYVYDLNTDVSIIKVDNRRYTMRDIGRIENRVKNLEYYTTLSLLEKDTQQYQIKDADGFDRFKNGFVVDNFTSHGVGDVFNRDYAVSINIDKGELLPLTDEPVLITLKEQASTAGARTANNYVVSEAGIATLPYTEQVYIENTATTRTENINPFNIVTWTGVLKLDPPADTWIDTTTDPTVFSNQLNEYDTFRADAQAKGRYGTFDDSIQRFVTGAPLEPVSFNPGQRFESVEYAASGEYRVNKVAIPKMRSVNIKFTAAGLKPNTKVEVYFDDYKVTSLCRPFLQITDGTSGNVIVSNVITSSSSTDLITNSEGDLVGIFAYDSSMGLNTGIKRLRISDSLINSSDRETVAEALFQSSGELVLSTFIPATRPVIEEPTTSSSGSSGGPVIDVDVETPTEPVEPTVTLSVTETYAQSVARTSFGREPTQAELDKFTKKLAKKGVSETDLQNALDGNLNFTNSGASLGDTSTITGSTYKPADAVSKKVLKVTKKLVKDMASGKDSKAANAATESGSKTGSGVYSVAKTDSVTSTSAKKQASLASILTLGN